MLQFFQQRRLTYANHFRYALRPHRDFTFAKFGCGFVYVAGGELARGFRSASLFSSPEKSLNFHDIGAVLIVSNDRTISDVAGGDGWSTASGTVGRIRLPLLLA
jgi:hypothetical protein